VTLIISILNIHCSWVTSFTLRSLHFPGRNSSTIR